MKVGTASQILMADACGNNDHISSFHMCADSYGVAQTNEGMPAVDAQDFVRGAVVMGKRIDAVTPGGSPIILGIEGFDHFRSLLAPRGDDSLVDQERQARIVRYFACIGELMTFDLAHGSHAPRSLKDLPRTREKLFLLNERVFRRGLVGATRRAERRFFLLMR
jgi:hypothetical protein